MNTPDLSPAQVDRARGVLVVQAAGDALGVPYEFAPRFTGDPQMKGGGLGPYAPGEYSDDTQMAVCIARVAATGADLRDGAAQDGIADGFLGWLADGATDVGVQTRSVLSGAAPGAGSARALSANAHALHADSGHTAGNGALMRTAVVGLVALDDRVGTAQAARSVATLTHVDPLAGDSCVLWSEAVRRAVVDGVLDLAAGLDLLPETNRDRWTAWIREATGADPSSFPNNGFTVTALQAAWAAITTTASDDGSTHVRAGLYAAVHAGNDTDTIAAIAGGLLGARWGETAVPAEWRDVVHGWPGLDAAALADLGESITSHGADGLA
jgi:ADP-ribosylglycohydrolase